MATESSSEDRRFRTFFIGAGFSALAGLPLGSELWQQVLTRVDNHYGVDNQVRADLRRYLDFKRDTTGRVQDLSDVDFEEFMAFLDIEHVLGLRGKDTWSEEGNKSQLIIRWFIGQVLHERQEDKTKKRPEAYVRFARNLRGSDYVLTFNYDTLLEESLDAVGRPYRLFPHRFRTIGSTMNTIDDSRDDVEVVLLKLHGSLDWFARSRYDASIANMQSLATNAPDAGLADALRKYEPHSPIFGRDRIVDPVPLVDGPRNDDDPLRSVFRVLDPSPIYARGAANPLLGASPLLLTPSYQKILYSRIFSDFWDGMGRGGGWSLGVGVIGFSLPAHDTYVLQAMYEFTGNYTESWYDADFFGKRKLPLRLVDLQTTKEGQEAYKNRYRFCNPKRTEFFFDGFGDGAIEFLFAEKR